MLWKIGALARVGLLLAIIAGATSFGVSRLQAQDIAKESLFITVPNPITGTAVEQIKSSLEKIRTQPNTRLDTVVFDFNPEEKEAYSNSYGVCYELANYIRDLGLNGTRTVAFLQNKTTGHTVLPAIACTELVMSDNASIGQVIDSKAGMLQKEQLDYYLQVGRKEFEGLIQKMLDKNTEVVRGTRNQATIFFDGRKKNDPAYANVFNVQPVAEMNPGSVELYTANRARTYGLCTVSLPNRAQVAEWYGVNLRGDFNPNRPAKACKIDVAGAIDTAFRDKLHRQLMEAVRRKENTIFLIMNSDGGGDAKIAYEVAEELSNLMDSEKLPIRTVAYIPQRAPDLVSVLALACSEIVMFKGSQPENEAILGDFENYLNNPNVVDGGAADFLKKNLPVLLKARGLPEILAAGLLNKDLEIYRVKNQKTGARTLMSKPEFDQKNADAKDWIREGTLKQPGNYLKLNATQAKELRLATHLVENRDFKDVMGKYGFEDVRDAQPHWLDNLAAVLRRTEVSALLILIGIAGLILELKVPGLTIPGIVSAICFLLFFWAQSHYGGQILYLAIALFMLGIVLIGIEIFLFPSGVLGVSGVILIVGGLGLATIDHIPQTNEEWVEFGGTLSAFGGSMIGSIFVVMLVGRFLPKLPFANRMVLVPPSDKTDADADLAQLPGVEQAVALLGAVGVATSTLRPAGLAKLNDHYVDVVTEGDFIDVGTPVQVIEVEGTRIVVRRVG
ncbi:hypothetical protein KIH39_25730 [Telmatocola sphagniphila]|uniref:NfeD-like C-terminal domain-containing protein n=1 Tax=Telmatocola sphagniphila TaxID=1123043 RepID=A0A8E6B868_9BACT|nr:NfeD family protein [Telmatocola sphagniphila]QVL32195.1 hypothetical protein KIH39_25730 [Telmatocola sphagniphila]